MSKTALVAALALAAAACSKSTPGEKTKTPEKPTTNQPATATGGEAHGYTPLAGRGGSVEQRLDRIEKRVDTITGILVQAMPPKEPDPSKTYSVAIDPTDPIEGPADARVTIVEGFEFLCPYCWKASSTVEQIQKAYPKDVRIVNKYFLIHGPPAIPPGLVACAAAKQGKYTEMKNLLWSKIFNEQGQPQRDQIDEDNLIKLAGSIGLDTAKVKTDMHSDACQDWLKQSQESLSPVGTTGTPSFYINGRHISGAMPFEQMKAVIDEEKAKADKAIAGGMKATDYYQQEVVAKGIKKVAGYFDD